MKKKWGLALLLVLILCTLTACGDKAETQAATSAAVEQSAEQNKEDNEAKSDTLIAVFSLSYNMAPDKDIKLVTSATLNKDGHALVGDTEQMAELAQEITGADRYNITLKEPYPADEEKVYEMAKKEQLKQTRPALEDEMESLDAYDNIILIYPNWFGDMPMAVYTFLESHDLKRKTIIPVVCYEAEDSGTETSWQGIEDVSKKVKLTEGYIVRSGATNTQGTRTDFKQWLMDLDVRF